MPEFHVNYLAVAVAALAPFIIGVLWYAVLFHKIWVKAHGYTDEHLEQIRKSAGRTNLVSLACYLVMAFALAVLISWLGVSTALQGACLGILVWTGFLATVGLTANMYSEKRLSTYIIDAGFQLAYAVTMGAILGAWQ